MKIGGAFPSKWLKADDIGKREVKVKIDTVKMENIGDEDKPVMYFEGKDKGMILNRTNCGNCQYGFGTDETTEWEGKEVILYTELVNFQGRQVPGLRIRVPVQPDDPNAGEEEPPF